MAMAFPSKRRLGEILLEQRAVRPQALDQALKAQGTAAAMPIGSLLLSRGDLSETDLVRALAVQHGVPGVRLRASAAATVLLRAIPEEVARAHRCLPLAVRGDALQVAIANPRDTSLLDEIAFATGKSCLPFVAPVLVLDEVIERAYAAKKAGEDLWRGANYASDGPHVDSVQAPAPSPAVAGGVEERTSMDTAPPPARRVRAKDGRRRVLAVDDEPEILDIIEKALGSRDIEVTRATRGHEALALLRQSPPDLVLLDAMLPEVHGFEICQRIKRAPQYADIPVIIISAVYTGWNFVQDVKRIYGADDYLSKPFRVMEMLRRVEAALASSDAETVSDDDLHDRMEAALREASEHCKAGRPQDWLDAASRAVQVDPLDPRPHFALGAALHRTGRLYEAISEFERVVELAPTQFSALKNLAVLYERQGFKAKAVEMWTRALDQSPSDAVRSTIKSHLIGLL